MRISDWSSDVCSSDLAVAAHQHVGNFRRCAAAVDQPDVAQHPATHLFTRRGTCEQQRRRQRTAGACRHRHQESAPGPVRLAHRRAPARSEEHTSGTPVTNAHIVCRLLLDNKKNYTISLQHSTLSESFIQSTTVFLTLHS